DLLAHARGELSRRLLRERDHDQPIRVRTPAGQQLDDPRDERGGLSRSGARLDAQVLVERRPDLVTHGLVDRDERHSIDLSSANATASGASAFRSISRKRALGQTVSKSHQSHIRSSGGAIGKLPPRMPLTIPPRSRSRSPRRSRRSSPVNTRRAKWPFRVAKWYSAAPRSAGIPVNRSPASR